MIHRHHLTLRERPLSLAGASAIRKIATLRIEALRRAILIKQANRDPGPPGPCRDQLLGCLHQLRCDPLPLEGFEDLQVMNQGDTVPAKLRVTGLPADREKSRELVMNMGKQRITLSLGVIGEVLARLAQVTRVNLIGKETHDCVVLARVNA